MPSDFIIDFEAFQIDNDFYPVELCLLNIFTRQCNMFFIRYLRAYEGRTIRYQYHRHGIDWKDGNITLSRTLKAICRRVNTSDDVIFVKGLEKANFLRTCLPKHNVIELVGAPSIRTIVDASENCCAFHYCHKNWACARRKAFAMIDYCKAMDTI